MWAEDEPNDNRLLEQCVIAMVNRYNKGGDNVQWGDKYCTTVHDYVCQLPAGACVYIHILKARLLPIGW